MKITNNFASTIIGTVSGRITYNGRTINIPQSSRMELVDGQILIDGKPFEQYDKADCPIIKSGDITCDCIKGHCSTMSGDIRR